MRRLVMTTRLTWQQIREQYPEQYVGLSDVKWKNGTAAIESAVVVLTEKDMSSRDIAGAAVSSHGRIFSEYTGDEPVFAGLGAL